MNNSKLSSNSQKYYEKFDNNISNLQKSISELKNENNNNLKFLNFLKSYYNFVNNNCDSILELTTNPKIENLAYNIKNNNLEKDVDILIEKTKKDSSINIELETSLQEINSLLDMLKKIKTTNNLTKHFLTCNLRFYKQLYNLYKSLLNKEMHSELKNFIKEINLQNTQYLRQIKSLYRIMF